MPKRRKIKLLTIYKLSLSVFVMVNSFNGSTTAATKLKANSKNSDSSCSCNQYTHIFFNYPVILQLSDINDRFSSKCRLRVSLNYRSLSASVIVFYIKWLSHLSQPKLKVLWIQCFKCFIYPQLFLYTMDREDNSGLFLTMTTKTLNFENSILTGSHGWERFLKGTSKIH